MSTETRSLASSATEGDLEEARQRLLEHHCAEEAVNDGLQSTLESTHRNGLPAPPLRDRNYGSVSTLQSIQQKVTPKIKRYRIPFLILIAFDFGMVIFLSIICSEWHNNNSGVPYFNFNIKTGFFDLVMLATVRVVFNVLFYLLLGWITRIVMGVVTVVSACFVPIKAYYTWDNFNNAEILEAIAVLLMLFVSFVLPWFTAFFFEFKYLPAEISRLDIPTWWDYRPWLWPRVLLKQTADNTPSLPEIVESPPPRDGFNRPRRTGSTLSLDFRTPLGSSRALARRTCTTELLPVADTLCLPREPLSLATVSWMQPSSTPCLRIQPRALHVPGQLIFAGRTSVSSRKVQRVE